MKKDGWVGARKQAEPIDEEILASSGWTELVDKSCRKVIKDCESMVVPEVGKLIRRTTRDVESRHLLEDLWLSSKTSEKLLHRSLRRPRDVEVQIEMASVDGDEVGLSWEEKPMVPKEATQYRAIAARLFFEH